FQLHVGLHQLAVFLVTHVILSFSTIGIPAHGSLNSLPAYMAAGIPIEGVVILTAVDAIPDIFKTLLNVTADMSAATILSRRDRVETVASSTAVLRGSTRTGESGRAMP